MSYACQNCHAILRAQRIITVSNNQDLFETAISTYDLNITTGPCPGSPLARWVWQTISLLQGLCDYLGSGLYFRIIRWFFFFSESFGEIQIFEGEEFFKILKRVTILILRVLNLGLSAQTSPSNRNTGDVWRDWWGLNRRREQKSEEDENKEAQGFSGIMMGWESDFFFLSKLFSKKEAKFPPPAAPREQISLIAWVYYSSQVSRLQAIKAPKIPFRSGKSTPKVTKPGFSRM